MSRKSSLLLASIIFVGCGTKNSKNSMVIFGSDSKPTIPSSIPQPEKPNSDDGEESSDPENSPSKEFSSPEKIYRQLEKDLAELISSDFKFSTQLELSEDSSSDQLAICIIDRENGNKILVDRRRLDQIPTTLKEVSLKIALLHQLGHCEFNRSHNDRLVAREDILKDQIDVGAEGYKLFRWKLQSKSLMQKNIDSKNLLFVENNLRDYLKELAFPQTFKWSNLKIEGSAPYYYEVWEFDQQTNQPKGKVWSWRGVDREGLTRYIQMIGGSQYLESSIEEEYLTEDINCNYK